MLLSQGFLITSALQTSARGLIQSDLFWITTVISNWWHALLHLSYFCHDGLPQYKPTHVLQLFKTSERVLLHWYSPRSLPDLESLPHLFLLFQYLPHLFSFFLESYRHLKLLKKFPLSTTPLPVSLISKLLCTNFAKSSQCCQTNCFFTPPVFFIVNSITYIHQFSPLDASRDLTEGKNQVIFIFVFCLLHLPTIICWMAWVKSEWRRIIKCSFFALLWKWCSIKISR